MRQTQKLTAQSIDAMRANEFHKDDFRKMLSCAEAINFGLYYAGELAGYESKLMLGDADGIGEIDTDYFITDDRIKTLAAILELCSAFAGNQIFDYCLLVEMTGRFCSTITRYDSKLIQDGTKVRYFRAEKLGELPDEFSRFYDADLLCYEFCLPYEMGALLELLFKDRYYQGEFDKMPPVLRTKAVFGALDAMEFARERDYFALKNREINEYFW